MQWTAGWVSRRIDDTKRDQISADEAPQQQFGFDERMSRGAHLGSDDQTFLVDDPKHSSSAIGSLAGFVQKRPRTTVVDLKLIDDGLPEDATGWLEVNGRRR